MPESKVCLRNSHKNGSLYNLKCVTGNTEVNCFDYHLEKYDIKR